MTTDLIIIGAGGFGRETLDVVEAHNAICKKDSFIVKGIIDDSPSDENIERLSRRGYDYLGQLGSISEIDKNVHFLIGIGSPEIRAQIAAYCVTQGLQAASVVHPSAVIGSHTEVSEGVIICAGVQVSTNVVLGSHVHLNSNVTVGHDTTLEKSVSVNPGAIISGNVRVKQEVLIGAGSVVLQDLIIGAGSIVGAAACVVQDVQDQTTVVGVPAK